MRDETVTRRLTEFSQVERLYRARLTRDFSPEQCKPLESMRRLWLEDSYECYGLFLGDAILGYAFFARRGGVWLLDYFAIDAARRGEGLGSRFLGQLTERLRGADCVVCEVEDPDRAEDAETRREHERRLRFYLRCGWRETPVTAVVFGVDYRVLELPVAGEHTAEALRAAYAALYRSMLPDRIFRSEFRAGD